jgi:hypothetical protein
MTTTRKALAVGAALLSVAASGCKCSKEEPVPAAVSESALRQASSGADRVAAGDLDGDGRAELVLVDATALRVVTMAGAEVARLTVPGGIQVLRLEDIDGDGRAEILAGWGRTRTHRDAAARVSIYRLRRGALNEQRVAEPETTRNEVVDVLPFQGGLLVANFESKYMVSIARADFGGGRWTLSPMHTLRMATSVALGDVDGDDRADLVIGRVYGDTVDADGDAFVLRPDGERVPIPVTGGVRSLALADLDGDGRLEILLGDGWNKNYGKLAEARLTRAWWADGQFRTELLDNSPGQYTLWSIVAADLNANGKPEIVTRGNEQIHILSREGDGWKKKSIASGCHDAAVTPIGIVALCEHGTEILRP